MVQGYRDYPEKMVERYAEAWKKRVEGRMWKPPGWMEGLKG